MKRASITEAKRQLSALLDLVRRGETVIIEDRGVPVAQLQPVAAGALAGPLPKLKRGHSGVAALLAGRDEGP